MVNLRRSWIASLTLACGPSVAIDDESTTTTTADDDDGSPGPSSVTDPNPPPPPSTTGDADTTSIADLDSEDGMHEDGTHFISADVYDWQQCDIWVDDCPAGMKCMPWANNGVTVWDSTRCSPIAEEPNAIGEPCTVEGSGISGIDDCEKYAVCWYVDPETNTGSCVPTCKGSPETPVCLGACASCRVWSDAFVGLCLPPCDPLVQDCMENHACQPVGDEWFACLPTYGDGILAGDPCEFEEVCGEGRTCAAPELVPGCTSAQGCCADYCNTTDVTSCDDSVAGTVCVPWFEGDASQCLNAAIGACLLPA